MSESNRSTPPFQLDPDEIKLPHSLRSENPDLVLAELKREILESNLLPKLVRRTRGQYLRSFAIPDLVFRLACQIERERRAGGKVSQMARAAVWRQVAEQSAPGKSQIPDATEADIQAWLPRPAAESAGPKSRTIRCSACGRKFREAYESELTTCPDCRKKARIAEAIGTAERPCGYCGNSFLPSDPKQVYHPACQKKAENRRYQERRKGRSAPIPPA